MAEVRPAAAVDDAPLPLRGELTRERVLAAASHLFATQGFDATSVEAVAAAAELTVPGMYRHFPGKDQLLISVARRVTRMSRARQALGEGTDLAEGLADLFEEYLEAGQIERRRLSIELSRASFQNMELHDALVRYNQLLRESLTATIAGAAAVVDEREAALLSHLVLIILMGAVHLDTLDPERVGDARLAAFLRRRFAVLIAEPGAASATRRRLPSTTVDGASEPEPKDGRRARSVRTRNRILAAAEELFALHGYDATTIEMLAARAEITVPGLYRHMTSKEALLVDVAQRAFSRYRLAAPFGGETGVTDQLADLLVAFSASGERVNRRLAVELDFGAWRNAELAGGLTDFHRRVRSNLASSLSAQEGVPTGDDHELRALVALMVFMGIAHLDTVDPGLIDDRGWTDLLRRRVPQLVG